MSKLISTEETDYTREQYLSETRWWVELSNGERAFYDDGRPDVEERSGWRRLARYVRENDLRIVRMWLSFRREQRHTLPENAEGYFFRKAVLGISGVVTLAFYVVGYLKDGVVYTQKWQVPELELIEEEERDPNDDDKVGESLIRS